MKSSEALQTSDAVQYEAGSYDVIVVARVMPEARPPLPQPGWGIRPYW